LFAFIVTHYGVVACPVLFTGEADKKRRRLDVQRQNALDELEMKQAYLKHSEYLASLSEAHGARSTNSNKKQRAGAAATPFSAQAPAPAAAAADPFASLMDSDARAPSDPDASDSETVAVSMQRGDAGVRNSMRHLVV